MLPWFVGGGGSVILNDLSITGFAIKNGMGQRCCACVWGGDAMMRVAAVVSVRGYRDDLIAGEEPELCVRLRAAGWKIWRLPAEMTRHDADMTHFGQWWRRTTRAGYAFAQGAYLHGAFPERHWVWESRRAWLWGVWLPLGCLTFGLMFEPWGWATLFIYPLQAVRQTIRNTGPFGRRMTQALFQLLARFPEAYGQINGCVTACLANNPSLSNISDRPCGLPI